MIPLGGSILQQSRSLSQLGSEPTSSVRYADVAHFVALSLRRDPKLSQQGGHFLSRSSQSKPSTAPAGMSRSSASRSAARSREDRQRPASQPGSMRARSRFDAKSLEDTSLTGAELGWWGQAAARQPRQVQAPGRPGTGDGHPPRRPGTGDGVPRRKVSSAPSGQSTGAPGSRPGEVDEFPPPPCGLGELAREMGGGRQQPSSGFAELEEEPSPQMVAFERSAEAPATEAPVEDGEQQMSPPSSRAGAPPEEPASRKKGAVNVSITPVTTPGPSRRSRLLHEPSNPSTRRSSSPHIIMVTKPDGRPTSPRRSSSPDNHSPMDARKTMPIFSHMGVRPSVFQKLATVTGGRKSLFGSNSPQEISNRAKCCELIRNELVERCGSAKRAFATLDLSRSRAVSLQEFGDGIDRLGINWQAITGCARPQEVFKLFDRSRAGTLRFLDLFPEASGDQDAMDTPRFWHQWCEQTHGVAQEADKKALPKWKSSADEEASKLASDFEETLQAEEKRRWIASTWGRLKRKGKSDSRCREIVARHLPRGTGPKDRDDVCAFTAAEVKACRKQYNDWVQDHSRKIQRGIADMRDQRKVLGDFRRKLFEVTMEPVVRQRQQEEEMTDLRRAANALVGPAPGLLDKVKEDGGASRRLPSKAVESDRARSAWTNFADSSGNVKWQDFQSVLTELVPEEKLADAEVLAWWKQLLNTSPETVDASPRSRLSDNSAQKSNTDEDGPPMLSVNAAVSKAKSQPNRKDVEDAMATRSQAGVDRFLAWWYDSELRSRLTDR